MSWWCDDRGSSVVKDRLSYAGEERFSKVDRKPAGGSTNILEGQGITKGIEAAGCITERYNRRWV